MAAQPTMRSKDTMQLLAAGCAALVVVGLCLAAHSGPVSLSETGVEPVFELSPREARGGASFPAQMRRTMFKARTAQLNVRDEGSTAQAYPEWARNGDMRREAQDDTGLPGWEPGSDYYSTRSWDNAPVKPPAGIKYFDPYVGEYGCPDCGGGVTKQFVYVFTVDASCEGAKGTRNINSVLHNAIGPNPFTSAAWATVKYHDLTWAEQQLAYLLTFYDARQLTLIIPPCFFPRFSVRAGGLLNQAVVDRGLKMLVVGGLTGASFLSDFMAGPEGVGYVDTTASSIDVVWTEGPFYMSNAATNTEFFYGPHVLPGVGNSVVGIPMDALPDDAIVYYMSYDEIAVVFEIPSGEGTMMFLGYDYGNMVPEWVDTMLLAERELDIRKVQVGLLRENKFLAPPPERLASAEEDEEDEDEERAVA